MATVAVKVESDHLERLAKTRSPVPAVAELIWNGLDAEADVVRVRFDYGALGGLEQVTVEDDGHGMTRDEAIAAFEHLGGSWKQTRRSSKNALRQLHGKTGQGRFRAFALGGKVAWTTRAAVSGQIEETTVIGGLSSLGTFEVTDAVVVGGPTGTTVTIEAMAENLGVLGIDKAFEDLSVTLALYLQSYPTVKVIYDGRTIDATAGQLLSATYEIPSVGDIPSGSLTVIEWEADVDRKLVLCDPMGVALHQMPPGVQARGFKFTAHLRSEAFDDLAASSDYETAQLHPRVGPLIEAAKDAIRGHFKRRAEERSKELVERWKADDVYPFPDEPARGPWSRRNDRCSR